MSLPWNGEIDWSDYVDPEEASITQLTMEAAKKHPSAKWSGKATKKAKWHPPKGYFSKNSDDLAKALKKDSDSRAQAMSRLNFYINRAGDNLSDKDRKRLNAAKVRLGELYDKEEAKEKKKKEKKS